MRVKNILLKSLYKITNVDGSQLKHPTCNSDEVFAAYRRLQDFSIETFNKNLLGEWELIELNGEFTDLSSSFIHTMIQTHRIWKDNWPCNILYVDADIICLNKCDLFVASQGSGGNAMQLPFFYNCGVRWFPSQMPYSQWRAMYENIEHWNFQMYDYEQETYKAMHSAMQMSGLNPYGEDMVFNVAHGETNNNIADFDPYHAKARMIHAHASRGPDQSLAFLKECWRLYGNKFDDS